MKLRKTSKTKGMAIPEVLISIAIGALLIGIVLSMWYFAYQNWTVERIRTVLRINLQIAVEHIKEEIRLSNALYLSLYKPTGDSSYTAISLPMATKDANGFYPLDTNGNIYWDRSVVYHIYENPPGSGALELRRTEFAQNNSILIDTAQREAQLASVVANGDGLSAANSQNSSTKTIFQSLVDLSIAPDVQGFDGYSQTPVKSGNISFGSFRLTAGSHEFKFVVTGKNAASSGYKFGIDSISITPSGCQREAETFTPSASSGEGYDTVYAFGWGGNNYLEYNADGTADYLSLSMYYDLWRESNFNDAVKYNTVLAGNTVYVQLADVTQGSVTCWQASAQTLSASADCSSALADITIRNLLSDTYIDRDGDRIRVNFAAHSATGSLNIAEAWIVRKAPAAEEYDATGTVAQLLFGGLSSVSIAAGNETWSDWTDFQIVDTNDYFVTCYISQSSYLRFWQGAGTNSYCRPGNYASHNDWTDTVLSPITSSTDIYAGDLAESWAASGTVMSAVYDTKIDSASAPRYNIITWDSSAPAGTSVGMEVCGSDNEDMSGAGAWTSVANGGGLPASMDGMRYAQFRATLMTTAPYTDYPWIDNVTIDWPGETKMCDVSGHFTKKPDYGIIELLIDNAELRKGYEFNITVSQDFRGDTYQASLTSEVAPRNTGK